MDHRADAVVERGRDLKTRMRILTITAMPDQKPVLVSECVLG